jgi:hypothetical protein
VVIRSGKAKAAKTVTIAKPPIKDFAYIDGVPKIEVSSWLEGEPVTPTMLLHTIVRNNSKRPIKVAISRREIACTNSKPFYWSPLDDVPQGLSFGPVEIEAGRWTAFVSVLKQEAGSESATCSADLYVSYERTRDGYEVLQREQIPITSVPASVWNWTVPVELPDIP